MRHRGHALWLTLVAATIAFPAPGAAVPASVGFSARLVDDQTGDPVSGQHQLTFELFAAETGGSALWSEDLEVEIEDGLLFTELGATTELDAAVLDGRRLFLEITLDDVVMEPRIALSSVPYALRSSVATNAETLDGLAPDALQRRISGSCEAGEFLTGVDADGSVACAPAPGGSSAGDVSGVEVAQGGGLAGGGDSGDVSLGLITTCADEQLLKFSAGAWECADDLQAAAGAGGDITSVTASSTGGLVGGSATGDVVLSLLTTCASGQMLKWNGSEWICANDDSGTSAGGDITSVTASSTGGLVGGTATGDAVLSLLTSCASGQMLKWSGSEWACADDNDTNAGGDITDVVAGDGLSGGGAGPGSVTLGVGAGTGISVAANGIALDTAFTDPRYVDTAGDSMSGNLEMAQQRVLNRGCPAGYVRHGPGLCLEDIDMGGLTFSSCANRCRTAGTHVCSSAEIRAVMQSGISIGNGGVLGDWVDAQDSTTTALVINSNVDTNAMIAQAVTSAGFCRCCANVE